jgi:TonB-dependent starch-binding outer membrane protein SusC
MKIAILFICLFLAVLPRHTIAQSLPIQTFQGRVLDDNGAPLSAVSVKLKGTAKGTTTNTDGVFALKLTERSGTLQVSFVGYETTELTLSNLTDFGDVVLRPANNRLNEVIVTGLGSKARLLSDSPGAVAVVTPRELENVPIVSIDRALQGKMAGVQVIGNSGVPGGGIDVRIRGIGSLNAVRQPLYIVDDVQISNYAPSFFPSSSALSFLNINDIESITVLKDPSEGAIYGAQAANGVVLIRTKRGKPADRAQVSFNASAGFTNITHKLDLLTTPELAQLGYEAIVNRYGKNENTLSQYYGLIDIDKIGIKSPADFSKLPTYDWQDAVFKTGKTSNYELSVSGGTAKNTYLLAGGYNTTEGPVVGTGFKKYTLRFNFDQQFSQRLRATTSLNFSSITQRGVSDANNTENPYRSALFIWPGNNPYNADGSFNTNLKNSDYRTNPLAAAEGISNTMSRRRLLGSLRLNYDLAPGLYLSGAVNIDYTNTPEKELIDDKNLSGGYIRQFTTEGLNTQNDLSLYYTKTQNQHRINAQIGGQYIGQHVTRTLASAENFPSATLTNPSAGQARTYYVLDFQARQASTFAKVDYTFADRYQVAVTARIDGSSKLGINKRTAFFPSVAGWWRISNESFIKNGKLSRWVSDLKLRLSVGTAGNNQLSNYRYDALGVFASTGDNYEGQAGAAPLRFDSPNLGWETNKSVNVGLDFGLFGSQITGSVDVFSSRRENLLVNKRIPATSGYTTVAQNGGVLQNRGVEIGLTYQKRTGAVQWESSLNVTFLKNKLISLYDNVTSIYIDGGSNGSNQNSSGYAEIGRPINSISVRKFAGVNPADGRPMYYDTAGQTLYFPSRQFLNRPADPTVFAGWANTVGIGNFELRVMLYGSAGNLIYNGDARYLSNSGSTADRNQLRSQLRRWQNPGDQTDVPKSYYGGQQIAAYPNADGDSDRFYEDGSYLRLREVVLTYKLPQRLSQKIGTARARIYLAATNLYTLTRFTGFDPEIVGQAIGVYPQARQYVAGFQLNF